MTVGIVSGKIKSFAIFVKLSTKMSTLLVLNGT